MRVRRAGAALVLCAVACTAGCGDSASAGPANAAKAKVTVIPAAREMVKAMESDGIGSTAWFSGSYRSCGRGDGHVIYRVPLFIYPFDDKDIAAVFLQQVLAVLKSDGWKIGNRTPVGRSSFDPADIGLFYFPISRGSLVGNMATSDNGDYASVAIINISSACVGAGSSASKLIAGTSNRVDLPAPTVTPSPRFS